MWKFAFIGVAFFLLVYLFNLVSYSSKALCVARTEFYRIVVAVCLCVIRSPARDNVGNGLKGKRGLVSRPIPNDFC